MACHQLVITADDLGYNSERDDGIIECYKAGAITRASLLINGFSAKQAAQMGKDAGLPFGLHLNLTEGRPASDISLVSSLIDPVTGFFWGKQGFREALAADKIDLNQVKVEIKAQVEAFIELTGCSPKHVDGHQHVHVLRGIRDVFAEVLVAYSINHTRLPLENLGGASWVESQRLQFYESVVQDSLIAKQVFTDNKLRFSDYFVGMTTMGMDMTKERLQNALSNGWSSEKTNNESVTCELMVHPGYPCSAGAGGCGQGPDLFSQKVDRKHEMEILMTPEIHSFYDEQKMCLIDYFQ